jgi:predicted AAA+ superfamily ATPase
VRVARYLESAVAKALTKKMVFVGGPRQVGKTTFALGFLGRGGGERHPAYLNWDHPAARQRLRNAELPPGEPLLLFDEIHKYARWRNLLKGIYDTERSRRRILVTGSARLDNARTGRCIPGSQGTGRRAPSPDPRSLLRTRQSAG